MAEFQPPTDPANFFPWLKEASERQWAAAAPELRARGIRFPDGLHWRPGLTPDLVLEYESALGFRFPEVYRRFLAHMNGTAPFVSARESGGWVPAYYSYPAELGNVQDMVCWIYDSFGVTRAEVERRKVPHLIPLTGHVFLVADRCESNPVLSMYGSDVVYFADSLEAFLVDDILPGGRAEPASRAVFVNFWYEVREEDDGAALWLDYLERRRAEGLEQAGPGPDEPTSAA